jgi:beta-galactosidase
MNDSPYDGQWRQMAWLLVARGARMVEYWHWHTLPFGAETYWGGVLPHSGVPGRAYREIARIGAELGRVGDVFAEATPEYDIAVLHDSDSKFALSTQGPVRGHGPGHVDPDSYRHVVAAFSRGVFDAKRQQRLVRREQLSDVDPERFPVLLVPALYTATDDDLDHLAAYARAGGHLVVGPRTGYGDVEGRARPERAPARLGALAGAWFEETSSLLDPVPVEGALAGSATTLAEGLVLEGAEALATYVHPHLQRWAAVTTRPVGAGRITVVGTVPDQELAEALARWLAPSPVAGWTTDASVTVATSRTPTGRLHVVHNWGWAPAAATPAADVVDLLTGERHGSGTRMPLGPWDVRVVSSVGP